jgi:restriction endonuclease S subunit
VRLNRAEAYPLFYYYFFASPNGRSTVGTIVSGTNIKGIRASELRDLMVPLPARVEQEAIAEALSDADALIESLEQLLTKKRQIKQGAMQELLTGKRRLPGFQSKPGYKQTELGQIPADWEVRQAGSLEPFVTSGSCGWAEFYSERGSAFVRITNLSRECIYLDLDDLRFVNLRATDAEASRTQLRDSDVLISITADIGIAGYVTSGVPKPAYINQHIALVRFDSEKANPQFIAYFLASERPQRRFRLLTDGGAKAGMNLTTIRQILLALPATLAEQTAIATVLSDMDADISALETKLAKARQIKQGMMQELLTGNIRLV